MRNVLSGCLVFAGLIMSAAPAFAGDAIVTPTVIFTCENQCVIIETDSDGNATRVRDSGGGKVTVEQRRQRTDKVQ